VTATEGTMRRSLRNEWVLVSAFGVGWALLHIAFRKTGHDGLELAQAIVGAPFAYLLAMGLLRLLRRPWLAHTVAAGIGFAALLLGMGADVTDLVRPVVWFAIGVFGYGLVEMILRIRRERQ
jgi:hypothetical protein